MKQFKTLYPNSFTFPALLFYLVFFVLPTLLGFYFAFTNWNMENLTNWSTIKFTGLDNFTYLFQDEDFILALKNTLVFAIVTSFFKLLFGLLLALGLNQPLYSRNYLRSIFYVPAVISITVIGLLFSAIFNMEGIVNQFLNAIGLEQLAINWLGDERTAFSIVNLLEIWKWSGFTMIIFLAGLQAIPKDYYEAAMMDGATALRRFFSITLPMLMPAMTINVTLNLIGGFKVFDQVYVLTNGQSGTEVINTQVFRAFSSGLYGRSSAMALTLFIFIAIIAISVNSFLRKKEVEM